MQCIDSPHGGEGRSESEVAGPAPSDILEDSSQFGAQGVVMIGWLDVVEDR